MISGANIFMNSAILLTVLVLFVIIKIIKSKDVTQRVVALDTINTLVVAILILFSAAFNTIIYIDIAIVYATLSFVSTIIISKYLNETNVLKESNSINHSLDKMNKVGGAK